MPPAAVATSGTNANVELGGSNTLGHPLNSPLCPRCDAAGTPAPKALPESPNPLHRVQGGRSGDYGRIGCAPTKPHGPRCSLGNRCCLPAVLHGFLNPLCNPFFRCSHDLCPLFLTRPYRNPAAIAEFTKLLRDFRGTRFRRWHMCQISLRLPTRIRHDPDTRYRCHARQSRWGGSEPAGDTHCYETSVIVGVQFGDVRSWAPAYKAHDIKRVGVAIAPRADHSHCQRPFFRLFDFKRLARCWARIRFFQQDEQRADRPHSTGRPHSTQLR
jgi:hypothetical protein